MTTPTRGIPSPVTEQILSSCSCRSTVPKALETTASLVAGAAQRPEQVYGVVDRYPRRRRNELFDERDGGVELVVRYSHSRGDGAAHPTPIGKPEAVEEKVGGVIGARPVFDRRTMVQSAKGQLAKSGVRQHEDAASIKDEGIDRFTGRQRGWRGHLANVTLSLTDRRAKPVGTGPIAQGPDRHKGRSAPGPDRQRENATL